MKAKQNRHGFLGLALLATAATGLLGFLLPSSSAFALIQDHFGYTIEEQSYNWVEAPLGTEALTFSNNDDGFASVDLPFEFPFYENKYQEVFVSTNGLLTFGAGSTSFNNQPIPRLRQPNNYIAALWDDLAVGGDYNQGEVLTFQAGDNFFIRWKEVTRSGDKENRLTFEAILSRDGSICFQYASLAGDLTSATIGIEDSDGVDGLQILYNSNSPNVADWVGNKKLCLKRPNPERRVKLLPPYQSQTATNRQADFTIQIKNTGDLGKDRYQLTWEQTNTSWMVRLFEQDGKTPLPEMNGIPYVEIEPGQIKPIQVRTIASNSQAGNYTQINLKATSANSLGSSASVSLQAAVLGRFVQFLADDQRGLNLHWFAEGSLSVSNIEADFTGSARALGEGLAGFYPLVWEVNGEGFASLAYQWLSDRGSPLFSTRFIENHAPGSFKFDREPYIAQMPDGTVAIAWIRNTFDGQTNQSSVYVLRINREGQPLGDLLNLTQQSMGSSEATIFSSPRLVSLKNPERWLVVWQATQQGSAELQWALFDANGSILKSPQTLLQATAQSQYRLPSLLSVGSENVLLFYTEVTTGTSSLKGRLLKATSSELSNPFELGQGWMADGVQMENGDVVVAWTNEANSQTHVRLLKSPNYLPFGTNSTELLVPYEPRNTENVSISRASTDTIVATWKDAEGDDYIYYALLEVDERELSGVKVRTPPMILYTAADGLKVLISAAGQGNASYLPAQIFLPLVVR